ncbi:MAG TPA: excinuclease ABC subunit UvrC [Candidatus Omnitrophota bacterium]|nr:excinuclease ABC subunit UvrC [Candidatus Omnitrophota bacterium]HPS37166.1 excinuclease ABC subunit UvrC [Candidatus Omnitrophota bacterium]
MRRIVEKLPLTSGVYLMKDAAGTILYIGKAKALRKRVGSYLVNRGRLPKVAVLMEQVCGIDHIDTPTEVDALLLEAHLIRKYRPKYNQELKDDKSFPLLKITREKFPRLSITRQRSGPAAYYYGPYTDSRLLRQAVNLINSLFPVRKCQALPKTACLYYHIGQCLAPCIKPDVKGVYDRLIGEVRRFLGGGKKSFMEYLTDRMRQASRELRFEDAQFFKEQIEALGQLRRKRFLPRRPELGVGLSATLELKQILRMDRLPARIACFDVSNIQGDEAVASRVFFYRELSDKLGYRRYKIRGVSAINDYAMLAEALTRMLRGIKDGRETFVPDLIMIDGGKGHLNTALKVLRKEAMENIELISIAKRFEKVYSPKFGHEILLPVDSPAMYLLQKVRDEAHRFAITYHRTLKIRGLERSVLDGIPGIGAQRKRMLLRHFESIEALKNASVDDISSLAGMDVKAAENVINYFKEQKK